VYTVDVGKKEQVYQTAERVKKEVGDITILILNAGIVNGKQFLETTDEQVEQTIRVNFLSHTWLVRAFLPTMIKNDHGHIVTISSAGINVYKHLIMIEVVLLEQVVYLIMEPPNLLHLDLMKLYVLN
jgi:short-subunit dehydrogenase